MMLQKLDIIITVVAAVVVAIVSFCGGTALMESAYALIITIIVFYAIGLFTKIYLIRAFAKKQPPESQEPPAEETAVESAEKPEESGMTE